MVDLPIKVFWRRRWVRGVVGLACLALALVLVVHSPPVRRAVLRRAVLLLQERLGIVFGAESLTYNLAALRVTLTGVDLAAEETPRIPFAHADALTIELPWSALFGAFQLDGVVLENARVYVIRRADGTTNLPRSRETEGAPAAVPIGRIAIAQLAIEVSDEPSGFMLSLPALTIDVGRDGGLVELRQPGAIARRNAGSTKQDPAYVRSCGT